VPDITWSELGLLQLRVAAFTLEQLSMVITIAVVAVQEIVSDWEKYVLLVSKSIPFPRETVPEPMLASGISKTIIPRRAIMTPTAMIPARMVPDQTFVTSV
jgi:hypothetical protein